MAECGAVPFTFPYNCLGNGPCNVTAFAQPTCQCAPGWDGLSDFGVTNSNIDCPIHVVTIQVLWGILLVLYLLGTVDIWRMLTVLYKKHTAKVKELAARGMTYTIRDNRALYAFLPVSTLGMVSQIAFCALKIAFPTQLHIGVTWEITILWWIGRTTFFFGSHTFQSALVSSILKSEPKLQEVMKRNQKFFKIHLTLLILVQFTAIGPLVAAQDEYMPVVSWACFGVYIFSVAFLVATLMAECVAVKRKVLSILDNEAIESQNKLRMKIVGAQNEMIRQSGIQTFIYALFALLVITWRFHDYLLPLTFISLLVTVRSVGKSLMEDSTGSSSSGRNPASSIVGTGGDA